MCILLNDKLHLLQLLFFFISQGVFYIAYF